MTSPVLSVQELVTEFPTADGTIRPVDHVSFELHPGETIGVVGESGSGKSMTALSILGLVPQPGRIIGGRVLLDGRDLIAMSPRELRSVRGRDISIVFQDPMSSLNPVLRVGRQIAEALRIHQPQLGAKAARAAAVDLLGLVGVPQPQERSDQYPHQYSGGMRQRAMIAMAIANRPKVLIADEPTTALDVTIQAQILDVLATARSETNAATILITHDLGLVAELADRVVVMYGGRVVETGDVDRIFNDPRHPYTLGLMAGLPRLEADMVRLAPIPGSPPRLADLPSGCVFHPRCALSRGRSACRERSPGLEPVTTGHRSACHFHHEMDAEARRVEQEVGLQLFGSSP